MVVVRERKRPPAMPAAFGSRGRLDRGTHLVEDAGDLAPQEDEGDDRDDGDEGEDQRVLRETLAVLVATKRGEDRAKDGHGLAPSLADWMIRRSPAIRWLVARTAPRSRNRPP